MAKAVSFLCFLSVLTGGKAPKEFTIAVDGVAQCPIVILSEEGSRPELAKELARWLEKITTAKFSVEVNPKDANGIILGTADDFPRKIRKERLMKLGPEGILVKSEKKRLWVVGNTELALQHSVYAFLEEVGCRWYFPEPVWTVMPHKPTLKVKVRLRERPAFGWRRIWYGWGPRTPKLKEDYDAWMKHNRQYGHFQIHCGHSYAWHIPKKEFEKHPEWFALVEGKRQPTQLCTTNPEVQRRVIEHALEVFRKNPERNMVSVEPNDGGGYCECKNCKKLGSVSDRVFFLANVVARALRKEFPDKWVGLYAYAYHSDPPGFDLDLGVYVQVTTGFRYTKLSFEEQVEAFRDRGATLGVYDYFSIYPWDWSMPSRARAGRVYQLANNIKRYHKLGLGTYTAESSCNWGPCGLGYWVAGNLMWDPELDPRRLTEDFYTNAFRGAKEPVKRLYERWATGQRFTTRVLKLSLLELNEAYRLAKSNEVRARLDRLAMYLHWLKLWEDYRRSSRVSRGKSIKDPDCREMVSKAKRFVVFSRRIMDTGLVHTYPMLFSTWFDFRLGALKKIKGFDFKTTAEWKQERTDIPTAEEMAELLEEDTKAYEGLGALEIEGKEFTEKLVAIAEHTPELVRAWGNLPRAPLSVESGLHYFTARAGETITVSYKPFGAGHRVDCHWKLFRAEDHSLVQEGDLEAEKEKSVSFEIKILEDGLYILDPGTAYWRAAKIGLGKRPISVWAGRGRVPGKRRRKGFMLWYPRLDQPLYFFVPRGTEKFVIGIPAAGTRSTTLVLKTADGEEVLKREGLIPGEDVSVVVPEGKDGQIWSITLASLRVMIELYDIPPYISAHPAELLVPEEVLNLRRE